MKTSKRILSLFLTIVMMLSIVPLATVQSSAATYDVTKAVSFANGHWNDGVGLCAEFVSRCLSAGGISIPNKAYYSSSKQSYKNNSGTLDGYTNPYTCSAALLVYLSEHYTIITNPSASDISVGDVVFMYSKDSSGNLKWRDGHVGIVISKSGGTPVYAAHNRATNSGRFSSSYPCTYVAKMGGVSSHTVDTKYGKNFTAYPKAKITASNIFDANHNPISSTAWIGTNDKCTINEVYTDGCCKVTYPLDGGGTQTAYSKISLFNIHTHNYSGARLYESEHPHAISQRCVDYDTCGGFIWTGEYYKVNTCEKCWNLDWNCSVSSVSLKTSESKTINISINASTACYPDGTKLRFEYDNTIIDMINNGQEFTFTGKKKGSCTFAIIAFSSTSGATVSRFSIPITVDTKTYTVTYDANGGTGAPPNQTKVYGEPLQLSNVIPIKKGYSFSNWYGNARYYSPGSIYNENAGIALKAIWKANTYTVKYNANGGTGTMANSSHTYDTAKALTANSFKRTGYSFAGWSTNSAATATQYADKESVKNLTATNSATVNLYARWKPNKYYVTYNANGGTGTTPNSSHTYDTAQALSANGFTRTGYTFLGWSTNPSATTATYTNKQSVKNLNAANGATVTLYAVWQKNPATVSSIAIQSKPTKTVYTVGEKFDASGLKIKVTMSDGTTKTVTSGFTLSNPDMSKAGTKSVTVTYSGKTVSFTITVKDANPPENTGALRLITPASARVGQRVQIPVQLDKASLGTLTFIVKYDHTKLKYISCTESAFDMCDVYAGNTGVIRAACIDNDAVSAGRIAVLTFEVIAPSACLTDLALVVEEAYDGSDKAVSLTGGTWNLSVVKTLPGDLNGDGQVTAIDARWALQAASGTRTLTDEQKAAADVNGDGQVTAIDARWILQVASGTRVF